MYTERKALEDSILLWHNIVNLPLDGYKWSQFYRKKTIFKHLVSIGAFQFDKSTDNHSACPLCQYIDNKYACGRGKSGCTYCPVQWVADEDVSELTHMRGYLCEDRLSSYYRWRQVPLRISTAYAEEVLQLLGETYEVKYGAVPMWCFQLFHSALKDKDFCDKGSVDYER